MSRQCRKCGGISDDDAGFCYLCGHYFEPVRAADTIIMCSNCGHALRDVDVFCKNCGIQVQNDAQVQDGTQPNLESILASRKKGLIAMGLALLPGLFNVFGLGHLYLRKWFRGTLFLAASVVVLLIWLPPKFGMNIGLTVDPLVFLLISCGVFFIQAIDLLQIIKKEIR